MTPRPGLEIRCGTCAFNDKSFCRRSPPSFVNTGAKVVASWPQTADQQWCGEWKPRRDFDRTGGDD